MHGHFTNKSDAPSLASIQIRTDFTKAVRILRQNQALPTNIQK